MGKPITSVTVNESKQSVFSQEIKLGNHILIADEPTEDGGKDLGPSPYEFLLASLGACTSMTLRMYAKLHNIPLDKVIVNLMHEKAYAQDCKNCDNPNSKIDHIDRKIELHGNLSPEQRSKLLEIANHCPVHRTLTSSVSITTELKGKI